MESAKSESPDSKPGNEKETMLIPLALYVAIGIVLGFGVFFLFFQQPAATPPSSNVTVPAGNNTTAIVPNVTITMIADSSCPECNSTILLAEQIKTYASQFGFKVSKVTSIDASDSQAEQLISKYSITKLPAMIVSREANISSDFVSGWANIGSQESDGAFVYRSVYPPYVDLKKNRSVGFVELIDIKADCSKCYNLSSFSDYLAGENVAIVFTNRTSYEADSSEAKALISKYNITQVPCILLSPDAAVYPIINYSWSTYGSVESDGWYVYRAGYPPYVDLTKNNSIVGLISLVELVDPTCTNCYNVSIHYDGLTQSFGMVIGNRTTLYTNSTEGKSYLAKYNITKVPTIILSPDALLYPGLNDTWKNLGSIENDGWLVFRELDTLGLNYTNVTAN